MLEPMLLPYAFATTTDAQHAHRAEEDRQQARLCIRSKQHYEARGYNIRHREVTYHPGEKVWIWSPVRQRGRSVNLLCRYFGPYRILERLNDVNYGVIAETSARSTRREPQPDVVHVARMKHL